MKLILHVMYLPSVTPVAKGIVCWWLAHPILMSDEMPQEIFIWQKYLLGLIFR